MSTILLWIFHLFFLGRMIVHFGSRKMIQIQVDAAPLFDHMDLTFSFVFSSRKPNTTAKLEEKKKQKSGSVPISNNVMHIILMEKM